MIGLYPLPTFPDRGGTMSTVSRNCRECAQRLRGGCENTTAPPGSRSQTPWVLRPKRGLPQFTHKLQRDLRCWRPGPGALACRPPWIGESAHCRPKSLRSVPPPGLFPDDVRGRAAVRLRAFHRFFRPLVATGLEPERSNPLHPINPSGWLAMC